MEQNHFSESLINSLQSDVLKAMQGHKGPYFAAFDADGTLWNTDMGEQFFQYQIDHCGLATLKGIDPWAHYRSLKAEDPRKAYLWLAQISQGHTIDQVREWAHLAVENGEARCFESQKKMISWLKEQGIQVFIVTASIQWAVEPAAHLMGVERENVIGIKTAIQDGLVTDIQDGPITWRQGKAEALLERTQGVAPIFCSGNTLGDISLIDASVGARLCVQTQTEHNSLFEEEKKLNEKAKDMGWPIHYFYSK